MAEGYKDNERSLGGTARRLDEGEHPGGSLVASFAPTSVERSRKKLMPQLRRSIQNSKRVRVELATEVK
jgi:hypothetical protein